MGSENERYRRIKTTLMAWLRLAAGWDVSLR
jgi:hypothetical protein